MSDYNKYISVAIDEYSMPVIIVFPGHLTHKEMVKAMTTLKFKVVVSAGFVDEFLQCYGESSSLHMKSKPEDTDILHTQLNINDKKLKFKR